MQRDVSNGPVTVAGVGAGHRTFAYSRFALAHPDRMKIVAVAEPDAGRRSRFSQLHDIPPAMQFESYADLVGPEAPLAQAVVNGTMDPLHFRSTMPLLEAGYDVLLEKPIAQTEADVRGLIGHAERHGRVVMICHVLRYAPFYRRIKDLLDDGAIGSIVGLTSNENVSYHHMAVGFIRGRWRQETANPMLLAKCCHDLDLIAWFAAPARPVRVASFGSLMQFRAENAPPGSAPRCLDGCRIEADCPYSARANYITQGLWPTYAWEPIEHLPDATEAQKLESLRTDSPFGRCVWHCDNDVVDHQTVIAEFSDGVTATHNMFGAAARSSRTIHILGSGGEIEGDLELGILKLRRPRTERGHGYSEEVIDVNQTGGAGQGDHGGGDDRLIADFISILAGQTPSKSVTHIRNSLDGHLIAFAADRAMRERCVVEVG